MVCQFVTIVNPAKTAELIEVPFECGLWWAQGTSIIRWGPDPPFSGCSFEGEKGSTL